MLEQSLLEALEGTFSKLNASAERHRQAQAYQAAQERLTYLHSQLRALHTEIVELRNAWLTLLESGDDTSGEDTWRTTCAELLQHEPATLKSPSSALVSGGIELLDLIAYIGAARAVTGERRTHLLARLEQREAHR